MAPWLDVLRQIFEITFRSKEDGWREKMKMNAYLREKKPWTQSKLSDPVLGRRKNVVRIIVSHVGGDASAYHERGRERERCSLADSPLETAAVSRIKME